MRLLHRASPPRPPLLNSATLPRFSTTRHVQVYITPPGLHSSSVNSVAWAPPEVGLALAAGSSDGTVSVLEYAPADTTWNVTKVSSDAAAVSHYELQCLPVLLWCLIMNSNVSRYCCGVSL
eukprot:366088-Chlamydomonas_euryale.AAC.21